MAELQSQIKESVDKLEVIILCPGLAKEDLTVSFDKKEGMLDILGKPKKDEISELLDLEISGKLTIPPKFRSNKIKATIGKGIAIIGFELAEDVNLITVE